MNLRRQLIRLQQSRLGYLKRRGLKRRSLRRSSELKDKFKTAGEKIKGLKWEKAALEKEKAPWERKKVTTALRHLKEINRLRDSRSYEVTHERVRVQMTMIVKCNQLITRDLERRRGDFETARSLQSQAFGMKRCLEALKESGIDIPQEMIDLFTEQEKEFEEQANSLTIGGIPEELLCLSPLHLPSPFLNENVSAAIDPYGSNANLIDAGTAAILQIPTSSWGDHAIEGSNNPTERDLEELSVRERGDVVGVERTEDASGSMIALVVPDPAPVASNLVVNEELSTPTLGVNDATLTLPPGEGGAGSNLVDLLELSDSSAEEDGGEKSGGEKPDEQVRESKPQRTEGNFGGSSSKEQGNVDEVENPSDPITDGTGSASDQFGARVVGEDFDRAED